MPVPPPLPPHLSPPIKSASVPPPLPQQGTPVNIPPPQSPKRGASRFSGDLSEEALAALLPPEEEDDFASEFSGLSSQVLRTQGPQSTEKGSTKPVSVKKTSSLPPPAAPQQTPPRTSVPSPPVVAPVPPPLAGVSQNISFIPPPIQGTGDAFPDEKTAIKTNRSSRRYTENRRTLFLALGGAFLGGLLLILLLAVVFRPDYPSTDEHEPSPVAEPLPSLPTPRPNRDDDVIEFINRNEPMPERNESLQSAPHFAMTTLKMVSVAVLALLAAEDTVQLPAEESQTLEGQNGTILSVALSRNGKYAATGSLDRSITIWNVETGQSETQIKAVGAPVSSLAFSPDGKLLVAGTRDKKAILWEIPSGKKLHEFPGHQGVISAVALNDAGTLLVVGVGTGQGGVWNAKDGKPMHALDKHTKSISAAVFAPDNTRAALASEDKTASIWNVPQGKISAVFTEHKGAVNAIAFNRSGNRVVTGSDDRTAMIWNPRDGKTVMKLDKGHTGPVRFVAFAPDDLTVYTAAEDKTFIQWDAATGQPLVQCQLNSIVAAAAMSDDAFHTIATSLTPKAILFRTDSLGFKEPVNPQSRRTEIQNTIPQEKPLRRLNPNLAVGNSETPDKQKSIPTLPKNNLVAFHPDGRFAVTVGGDKAGLMWHLTNDEALYQITERHPYTAVAFHPNGHYFACGLKNGSIVLVHPRNGETVRSFKGHTDAILGLSFSPNGQRLMSASADQTMILWDSETGRNSGSFVGHQGAVTAVAIFPDMSKAVSGSSDKTVCVWEPTGKLSQASGPQAAAVLSLSMSPNNDWFVIGLDNQTAVVWDAKKFEPIKTLTGFVESPTALATHPSGRYVVSGGKDGVAIVWSTESWTPVWACPQLSRAAAKKMESAKRNQWSSPGDARSSSAEPISCITFSKDGSSMLTSGGTETFLWEFKRE